MIGPFGVRGPSGRAWTVGEEASDGTAISRRGVEDALVTFLDAGGFDLMRRLGSTGAWVPASREELAWWSATDPLVDGDDGAG